MPKIQFRRDSSANWSTHNPILSDGEIGIDSTTHRFKLGDGVTSWNSLVYSSNRLQDDYFSYLDKEEISAITYNGLGQVATTTYTNGCVITYSYVNNLLQTMVGTSTDGVTPLVQKTFNYDGSNRLISIVKTTL